MIIMVQENILFDEINTSIVSLPKVSEVVAISHREFLVACYQPSASGITLFDHLDMLLRFF